MVGTAAVGMTPLKGQWGCRVVQVGGTTEYQRAFLGLIADQRVHVHRKWKERRKIREGVVCRF